MKTKHATPNQIYAKDLLASYLALKRIGCIFWGTTKTVIVITASKSFI